MAEICAINARDGFKVNREEILEDPLDILSVCSSLVTIITNVKEEDENEDREQEAGRQVVVLAHYSVKEYFLSERITKGSAADYSMQVEVCHNIIVRGCLGYLLQFDDIVLTSENDVEDYKLAEYCAKFWVIHARDMKEQTEGFDHAAMALFSKKKQRVHELGQTPQFV